VRSDEIIFKNLKNSGAVAYALSEEKPEVLAIK
jgi:fructose-1,6-bisphosphatase